VGKHALTTPRSKDLCFRILPTNLILKVIIFNSENIDERIILEKELERSRDLDEHGRVNEPRILVDVTDGKALWEVVVL
jgi:hypothetical protein